MPEPASPEIAAPEIPAPELAAPESAAPEFAAPQIKGDQPETVVNPERPEAPYLEVLRATRWFLLYGNGGFAVLCILIGAVEGLFGR